MQSTSQSQLATLLKEDLPSLRAREEELIAQVPDMSAGVILYGAGALGRSALAGLRKAGVPVLAFADRNPTLAGACVDGVPVKSLADAAQDHGVKTPIIVTIYTAAATREQLRAQGFRVVSSAAAFLKYPDHLLPHQAVDHLYKMYDHHADIQKGFSLWSDEESRREYVAQIKYRLSLDGRMPASLPPETIYFPEELIRLHPDECFVDCGAYDGDSIRSFLSRSGTSFGKIIALEPDTRNCGRLREFVAGLAPDVRARIKIIQMAADSSRKTAFFEASGTVASHSADSGTVEVQCAPLDELIRDDAPTYIKMDIEGAEPDALAGARSVIQQHLPVLAISLYHRQEHLWQLPLLVRSLAADYQLFLRRYSDDCWEQLLYAIPPGRLVR